MTRYQITYPTTPSVAVIAGLAYLAEGSVVTVERRVDPRRSIDRAVVEVADPEYFEQQAADLLANRTAVVRLS